VEKSVGEICFRIIQVGSTATATDLAGMWADGILIHFAGAAQRWDKQPCEDMANFQALM